MMHRADDVPPFVPHRFLSGGHAQTIVATYLPGELAPYQATRHAVPVSDGDQIVLHDDRPAVWRPEDRTAMLIHGLGGCHQSSYMIRVAAKLVDRGVRVFRMDMRGCGAGVPLARLPMHSGRSEDAAAALEHVAQVCLDSPTTLVGFSLGGNVALKLLGELGDTACGNLDHAVVVCPPIDLDYCAQRISSRENRVYDRHFVKSLIARHRERLRRVPWAKAVYVPRAPRTLREFDEFLTAPINGFASAADYYERSSSGPLLKAIRRPTRLLVSRDDPVIPVDQFDCLPSNSALRLTVTERGGHLGFIGRRGVDADRRWMDWRVVEWVEKGPN